MNIMDLTKRVKKPTQKQEPYPLERGTDIKEEFPNEAPNGEIILGSGSEDKSGDLAKSDRGNG